MRLTKRLLKTAVALVVIAAPMMAQPVALPQHVTPWAPIAPSAPAVRPSAVGIPLSSTAWTPIGPAPLGTNPAASFSGRIAAVAPDPADANTIYIAAAGGGVWKTTNANLGTGTTWVPLTDPQSTLSMGALAVAPSNHLVVYAGTGEANNSGDSNYGRGILVSTDAGATWTLRQGPGNIFNRMTTAAIAVHPTDPNTAYAAMADFGVNGLAGVPGIYKTTDGGATWVNTSAAITTTTPYSDVKIDLSTPTTLYMAVGNIRGAVANGVYKSTNSGGTWTLLAGAPSGTGVGRISIAVSKSNSAVLYVTAQDSASATFGHLLSVKTSADGGSTFTDVTPVNYMGSQGWYDQTVIVDPANSAIVYVTGSAGTNSMLRSLNSGGTWTDIHAGGSTPHADHHGIAFDANGLLLDGDDGGIFRLDNPSTISWTDLNGNLQTIQFQGIDLHPTDANQAVGGSQDNGTEVYSGTVAWTETDGGDGGFAKYNVTTPTHVYHQIPVASFGSNFFRFSSDGGATWTTRTSGIVADQSVQNFYAPFVVDPGNGNRVLYGTNRVWETTNEGTTWTPLSAGALSTNNNVRAIGLAPSDTNTIYASTSANHLFVTTDHGATWTDRPIGVNGTIADIQVDPATPTTAFAVLATFTLGGNVFKTTNGGSTWTNISGTLPNEPVWSLQFDKGKNILYVGADDGVYSSTDGGTTWSRFGTALPNAQVFQVVLRTGLNILGAATHGRGAFEIQTTAPALVSPTISKAFLPTSIASGGTSVVTVTLSNSNTSALTGGAFTDTLVNMSAAGGAVGGTCVGTTPNTLAAGATALSFTGITIPASGSCTVTFTVTSSTTGANPNQTSGVTTTQTPTAGAASNIATLTVSAITPVSDSFQISYAANLSVGDSFVNITNAGTLGASLQSGTTAAITGAICANVYAFTPDEQLVSCCSCPVTPNGLVSLSAKNDLASNTLTPAVPTALVIKVLATAPVAGSCTNSAAAVTAATLAPGIKAFGTTIHATPAGDFGVTERPFSTATLSQGELSRIGSLCNFILANGSGFGVCRSCRLGGLGSDRQ